jgi:hypothetical protein
MEMSPSEKLLCNLQHAYTVPFLHLPFLDHRRQSWPLGWIYELREK